MYTKKSTKKTSSRKPRHNGLARNSVPLDPPPRKTVVPYSRCVTFQTSAAQTDFEFTVNMLLRLQSMCSAAIAAFPLAYAVRVRRVSVWATANALAATTGVALEWNAGTTGFLMDGVSVSDFTASSARAARISTTPPTESLGSWYQAGVTGGTNVLFALTCPGAAVIQLEYDWVPNLTEPGLGQFSVTGGSSGFVFAQHPSSTFQVSTPLNALF